MNEEKIRVRDLLYILIRKVRPFFIPLSVPLHDKVPIQPTAKMQGVVLDSHLETETVTCSIIGEVGKYKREVVIVHFENWVEGGKTRTYTTTRRYEVTEPYFKKDDGVVGLVNHPTEEVVALWKKV